MREVDRGVGEPGADLLAPRLAGRLNPRYLALLRVDVQALHRGRVAGGELCEIRGVGPVPVSVAEGLLGRSVLQLVITRGVDVLNVTHLGRGPTAAQKIALAWASPGCTVAGCWRTRTENDHREPWAQTRHTRLDELDPLCAHHHDLKTRSGWALVDGTGKRPMVPPDDPQHPNHRSNPRTGWPTPAANPAGRATAQPNRRGRAAHPGTAGTANPARPTRRPTASRLAKRGSSMIRLGALHLCVLVEIDRCAKAVCHTGAERDDVPNAQPEASPNSSVTQPMARAVEFQTRCRRDVGLDRPPSKAGCHLSVVPSIRSRSRSACPLCWAYSSIMCRTTVRTDMTSARTTMVSSYDAVAIASSASRHSSRSRS